MSSIKSRPEVKASASIPSERTSRLMARQTDSSSSTMAISGLVLPVTNPYFAQRWGPECDVHSVRLGVTLAKDERPVYWTLVQ
jgi:hypothetical protein